MMKLLPLFVILAVALMVLGLLKAATQKRVDKAQGGATRRDRKYKKQDFILTKAELTFLSVLDVSIPPNTRLYPQVLLRAIITAVNDPDTRTSDQNQINQKYVDFALCDAWSRPLLVIELDDSSHNSARRRERDTFLESALASAGVPLLRVPARGSYDVNWLRAAIGERLAGALAAAAS